MGNYFMIFSMLLKALMLHYYNLALLPNYIDIIKLFLRTTNYRTLKICHFFFSQITYSSSLHVSRLVSHEKCLNNIYFNAVNCSFSFGRDLKGFKYPDGILPGISCR